jgi:hypothetical protein
MSRLQKHSEYLLLKGDLAAAQHEIAVLAHNHEFTLAALTDDATPSSRARVMPGWDSK